MNPVTIMIVEDQILVAKLLKAYLQTAGGFSVLHVVPLGKEAIKLALEKEPDVILMDVELPDISGVEVAEEILKQNENQKILMLSCNLHCEIIQKSLNIGASGYVSKFAGAEDIVLAINTVVNGGCYLCRESIRALSMQSKPKPKNAFDEKLTIRENEILALISKGYSNHDIADKLCLSIRTVETHRRNILHKFGEKNFLGLIHTVMEVKHNSDVLLSSRFMNA